MSTPAARDTGDPVVQTVADGTNGVDKLLVFVIENRSRAQMVRGLPWVAKLGEKYGTTTDFHAITHPSLPNYLVMAGGSTFGIADDAPPSVHAVSGSSVFGEAIAAGGTARVYAESMSADCQVDNQGKYAVRHNPWAYFVDERADCEANDVSLAGLAKDIEKGRLPDVGMVIPNLCDDAHDCRLARTNTWLRQRIKAVMAGPDWAQGHLGIVITADEDDREHGQLILTVLAHPYLRHVVVSKPLDHFGLSRAYAEVAGVTPLEQADGARSVLSAFGLVAGR